MDGTSMDDDSSSVIGGEQHSHDDSLAPNDTATKPNAVVALDEDPYSEFQDGFDELGDFCAMIIKEGEPEELDCTLTALDGKHKDTISESDSFEFKNSEEAVDVLLPTDNGVEERKELGAIVEATTSVRKDTSPGSGNADSIKCKDSSSDSTNLEVESTVINPIDHGAQCFDQDHALVGESSKLEEEHGAVGGTSVFSSKPKETLTYDHDLIFTQFLTQCIKYKREQGFIPRTDNKHRMATDSNKDFKTFCLLFVLRGTNIPKILRKSKPEFVNLLTTRISQYKVYTGPIKKGLGKDVLTVERIASLAPQHVCKLMKLGHGDLLADLRLLEVSVPRAMQTSMFAGVCPTGPPKYCYYFYYQLSTKVFKRPVSLSEIVKRVDTVFQGRTELTLEMRQNYCVALELASLGENGWSWNKEILDIFEAADKIWDELNEIFHKENHDEIGEYFEHMDLTEVFGNFKLYQERLDSRRQTVHRRKHWHDSV